MTTRNVGMITFRFPTSFSIFSFDELSYYRKHFQAFAGGAKGVDLVAIDPCQRDLWLIEVKDYRGNRRSEKRSPFRIMAEKIRDTLAGLAALACWETSPDQPLARNALSQLHLRVVFHLEQAKHPSRMCPWVIDPRTASDLMKREFRMIDPHSMVGGMSTLNPRTPWQAR